MAGPGGFERKDDGGTLDAKVRALGERARAAGTARTTHNGEVKVRRLPQGSPILEWLALNGRGSAPQIARAIGRPANNVGAQLRQWLASDPPKVRRVGHARVDGEGPEQVMYELADEQSEQQEDEMAAVSSSNGDLTVEVQDVPEQLTANELDELISGWAGQVTIAEATASTLMLALKARRVQEALAESEAQA